MKLTNIIGLCMALVFSVLTSCSNEDVVFQQAVELPEYGWSKDSTLTFVYDAADTAGLYDVVVDLRNDGNYQNQNFWLFINSISPDSAVFKDTL